MNKTENKIRLILLNKKLRKIVHDLMITQGDDYLLNCIALGLNTTALIVNDCNSPVQSISARLHKLYYKGYIDRTRRLQDSGGYEWVYSLIPLHEKPTDE
jgi:hypothetical protein